ncbi:MAG: transposase [Epsilonproteobacteria bacterium]|nr:transposase [Campylobacterota bacterium]
MPRRARVMICGYHHVYNRGVAKNKIFLNDTDKEKFLEILGSVSKQYKFNIHSFCLMNNHYHLLLENTRENLSEGMRQLNAVYAMYFNQRYKRVGHLWQDRFKSWYIADEKYLFTLFKYIEANPLKANLSKKIGEYKYSSTYSILRDAVPFFLRNSFVLRDYHTQELFEILNIPMSKKEQENVESLKKIKYTKDSNFIPIQRLELQVYFKDTKNKKDRNVAIQKAFDNEYSKSEIAKKLGLSVTAVCKILKKFKV